MPFAIGWKPPAEAEGTCVEVSEVPDDEVVEIGVDTAVLDPVVLDTVVIDTALLLGGRPGILRGMHVDARGMLVLYVAFVVDGKGGLPSAPTSTFMSRVLLNLTLVEELPLHTSVGSGKISVSL